MLPKRILLLFIILLAVGAAVLSFSGSLENEKKPPVFLIMTESMRADHIGPCYGYNRTTAPNICEMADDGVIYQKAYSTGTHTPMSLPSIITGFPPNSVGFSSWGEFSYQAELSENVTSVAEVLAVEGYSTYTNIGNAPFLWDGIRQGFQKRKIRSLDRHYGYREFYWIRLFEAHYPYAPSQKYRKWDNVEMDKQKLESVDRQKEGLNLSTSDMVDLYDAEILQADAEVENLTSRLKDQGLYEDSLIIITSDHGESFGDQGNFYHANRPYSAESRVPLIVKYPGNHLAGSEVRDPVSLASIVPTIYESLGIERETFRNSLNSEEHRPVVTAQRKNLNWALRGDSGLYMLENVQEVCLSGKKPSWELSRGSSDTEVLREQMCEIYRYGEENRFQPEEVNMSKQHRQRLKDLGYLQ